ncbi:MAG: ASKHA domain-containing protein [Acidobacteria bacterium]|nr:ASKHA domain-containing protein [Acidobacteriota bacterium]
MTVRIRLEPLGRTFEVEPGTPLRDILFGYGVEFPCGGRGHCRHCRVRLLEGASAPSAEEATILSGAELSSGWRLACRMAASSGLTLEIAQWETSILAGDAKFEFTPREGLGVAVDVGTTTLVAQLVDLRTANVMAVRTALNPQAAHGADVMSRVQYALTAGGRAELRNLIRAEIGGMVAGMLAEAASGRAPSLITVVGNTVMHHLFCGVDVTPLAAVPFQPREDGEKRFRPAGLGWDLPADTEVRFLACLGGFVGSDIRAGIMATKLAESDALTGLIDLGTNGEIVFGTRERIVCASTAAGPAFEGGRISCGMRAATGAISEVSLGGGKLVCSVIGQGQARGICGSGLVDAVACGLELDLIQPRGKLSGGLIELASQVALTQADIREVQLAKGAIAAGARILLARLGAELGDVRRLYLAGAFGNYINRESARRIGLIEFPPEVVEPAGNTALSGAKLALFEADPANIRVEHVPLAADPEFLDTYVASMPFRGTRGQTGRSPV